MGESIKKFTLPSQHFLASRHEPFSATANFMSIKIIMNFMILRL